MNEKMLALLPKLYSPAAIFAGSRAFSAYASGLKEERILALISKSFHEQHPEALRAFGDKIDFGVHSGEPTAEDFEHIKARIAENEYSVILAVGGGSVIDLAKLARQDTVCTLIAIPTTIGSGAEVSQHAVLIDDGKKRVLSTPALLPDVVLLNPEFLNTLSTEQLSYQAFDAFAHALESLVSKMSHHMSDMLALSALETLHTYIPQIDQAKENPEILEQLQAASTLAGMAQSVAATGLAHAFAHYLGPKYNIPHTQAVSTFLADVVELNQQHTDLYEKLDRLANLTSENIVELIRKLQTEAGITNATVELEEEIDEAADGIRKDICTLSNPYAPKPEDIVGILKKHTA